MNRHISSPAAEARRRRLRSFFIPLGCSVLCLLLVVPWAVKASGGEGGFDGVISSIESRYHVHAMRIPFLSLVSFVAGQATHNGVDGVKVATFEHFSKPVDGDELNRMVEEKLGEGWGRMIRETSRHGGEQTLIFARPEGRHMGLFILDLDGSELDVVQVSVDPDYLNDTLGKYDRRGHDDSGNSHESD